MLPFYSGILAKATSTLIKTYFAVFFLNLCYTVITCDELKSNE